MITQLMEEGASTQSGGFFQTYGLLIIMLAFIVVLIVVSTTKRKKESKMADEFVNNLKVGDKIKTYSGIFGTIIALKEKEYGKIAVIETGEGNNKTTMVIDLMSIYCITEQTKDKDAKGIELLPKEEPAVAVESTETTVAKIEESIEGKSKSKEEIK